MDILEWIFKTCLIIFVTNRCGQSLPVGDSDNMTDSVMDGKYLVSMATKVENPLLKLLGKTFINMEESVNQIQSEIAQHEASAENDNSEILNVTGQLAEKIDNLVEEICLLHPCSEWSDWTVCDAKRNGTFGSQNRTRKCGYNTTLCTSKSENSEIQRDIRLCEYKSLCPSHYRWTEEGYCVKLYAEEKKTWFDAQQICSEDGGHLINIHSEKKSRVAEKIFEENNVNDVWIDGIKRSNEGGWEFLDKSKYTNWQSGQPDRSTYPSCIDIYKSGENWMWYDGQCSEMYYLMCEIY